MHPIRSALLAVTLVPVLAAAAQAEPPARTLTVTGTGEVSAVPDEAQLSAGVVSEATTADAALVANSREMHAVLDALKAQGLAAKDIQTAGFSVSPQYPPYNSAEARHITGYQVSNTVRVRLHDMSKIGPVLDALVSAGANQVDNIAFSISDPAPLLTKARVEAVHAAQDEAQTYARAAGVTLGQVLTIVPSGSTVPRPMPMMALRAAAAPTPIAAGESTLSASVTITWQIR